MSASAQLGGCGPILCAHLLRQLDEKLIDLLESLTPSEWDCPTIAPMWKVRDVAAHLLDTALRKLSLVRDLCCVEKVEIQSHKDVIALVNRLNCEGVVVYRRLSPTLLIAMMRMVCDQYAAFHESLDPFASAAFSVSWAGEETSLNWFDTARELTERWHHQQQIRLATNRPGIMIPTLYFPVLDCFARGLPYAYQNVEAPEGTSIQLEISGDCGGQWVLTNGPRGWGFPTQFPAAHACRVVIPQDLAWRVFTKGIAAESVRLRVGRGDPWPYRDRWLNHAAHFRNPSLQAGFDANRWSARGL